jgi:hypothetical protein
MCVGKMRVFLNVRQPWLRSTRQWVTCRGKRADGAVVHLAVAVEDAPMAQLAVAVQDEKEEDNATGLADAHLDEDVVEEQRPMAAAVVGGSSLNRVAAEHGREGEGYGQSGISSHCSPPAAAFPSSTSSFSSSSPFSSFNPSTLSTSCSLS